MNSHVPFKPMVSEGITLVLRNGNSVLVTEDNWKHFKSKENYTMDLKHKADSNLDVVNMLGFPDPEKCPQCGSTNLHLWRTEHDKVKQCSECKYVIDRY